MRVLVFLSLLCVVASGQTITRRGFVNGTAGPGGCGTANSTDVTIIPIGVCQNFTGANDTTPTSVLFNDCSPNGLITLTRYNGSSNCDPATVLDLRYLQTTLAGTSGPFCQDEGGVFATYTCSPSVYPGMNSRTTIAVTAYVIRGAATPPTTCSGPSSMFTFQAGVCTPIVGYGIMANCVNNTLVTGLLYDTPTCEATWNATANAISNNIFPIGPYAQIGATSAQGKPQATPGASCGLIPTFAFTTFNCTTASTPAPTTAAPTTKAPTAPPSSSSSTGVGAASTVVLSIAALIAPIIAAVSVLN